jgi:hypothetical protein
MTLIICPGIHDPHLTQEFLEGLQWKDTNCLVFPAEDDPAYSAVHVSEFLRSHLPLQASISLISFSAGVVGAIGAAWTWQLWGGQVKAFFALDGWGVPLAGNFPIYRLSHDYFTHWSSALLGTGEDSFYADPPVDHLDLWRSPHTVPGWRVHSDSSRTVQPRSPTTAANFLQQVLASHEH